MKNKLKKYLIILFVGLFFLNFANQVLAEYTNGYYQVNRIIDGDTFELADGMKVRLIGINTPEEGEACFSEATEKLSSLILNKTVYLEKDVSATDQYNRLLRYVYYEGSFINYVLVYDGFARAVEYPPDTKYASMLKEAETSANDNHRGCLWDNSCLCYVHITETGSKYHSANCQYLKKSNTRICKDNAITMGYSACSVCNGQCDLVTSPSPSPSSGSNGGSSSSSDGGSSGGGCFILTVLKE